MPAILLDVDGVLHVSGEPIPGAADAVRQLRNRELAVERVVAALREALRVERRRVATKPPAASRERRLDQKRRRGEKKRLRRPPE